VRAAATLIPGDLADGRGSVRVVFERTNDVPAVTCDLGIMKSFGISRWIL
jgi:hypothetical protein